MTNSILTWNLQHGGGTRITKIIDTLRHHRNVSTIILTEFRNNDNSTLIKVALTNMGFNYQYITNAEAKKNSVFIASKTNFKSKLFPELANHSERVIKVYNDEISIYGCYFPMQNEKKYVFEFLLQQIKDNPKEKIIIAGDFNTGKHFIDEKGATFFHSDYLDIIEQQKFFDAWRLLHKDKREYSWYSSNGGNGFRLDHFFLKNDLKERVLRCDYFHEYRENKISDHSLMILELLE